MDRISGFGYVLDGAGHRVFQDENQLAGIDGTDVEAVWLTGVQEELVALIEAVGLVPDAANNTLLAQALSVFGRRRQYFSASGAFVVPPRVYWLRIPGLWAGGGGGGGSSNANSVGSGGGGGCYAEGAFAVTPGQTFVMTVGAAGMGGAPGVDGTTGGNTSFGTLLTAVGGGAGKAGVSAIGTPGGAFGSATIDASVSGRVRRGGGGGTGFQAGSTYVSGLGGDAQGSGFSGLSTSNGTTPQVGTAAAGSGQGGGGGVAGGNGGSGGAGLVVVEY